MEPLPMLRDVAVEWPHLFPPSVLMPRDLRVLEFRPSSSGGRDIRVQLESLAREVVRHLGRLQTATDWFVVSVAAVPANRIHERRGYWNVHPPAMASARPVARLLEQEGDDVLTASVGALCGDDERAEALVASSGWCTAVVVAEGQLDHLGLLEAMLGSPHRSRLDHPLRYFLPELIEAVGSRDAIVCRGWAQDDVSVDLFGSEGSLTPLIRRPHRMCGHPTSADGALTQADQPPVTNRP